jgi:hypothetical protein
MNSPRRKRRAPVVSLKIKIDWLGWIRSRLSPAGACVPSSCTFVHDYVWFQTEAIGSHRYTHSTSHTHVRRPDGQVRLRIPMRQFAGFKGHKHEPVKWTV